MVRGDDHLELLRREKRSFDILSLATERIIRAFSYEEEGETSTGVLATVKDNTRKRTRTTMCSSSGKRQKMMIGKCKNQYPKKQNLNRDACSLSLCHVESKKRGQVVSKKKGIVDMDFLNEDELEIIDKHFRKKIKKGVDFTLVDSNGKKWGLNLRRWDMRSNSNYALASGWNKVVAGNRLEEGQTLQIWSFRKVENKVVAGVDRTTDELYVAFAPLDPATSPAPAPALSLSLALVTDPAPAPAPVLSLSLALVRDPTPVVTRDSDELYISKAEAAQEENDRIFPIPEKNLEGLNMLVEVCEKATHLEALQEANRRSSLASITELDLQRSSLVSDTELDLELRL
ncbi:B3 domain-containing protein At2g31720 [Capsella rubella]|uniref:B3 domain-containing protein At2g31720 n=1 Tax=Capsella rubella TaxID=81985 RepID=UPI000CD5A152|nr:B3 domain-containing protein At2g31720 [Capsella rubella]